jgi:hypothetical protein
MTTRLPLALESLRIATPCHADWDEMSGDARVRFCGRCEKNVYNLSAMTRAEAEALVQAKEGRLCVRLFRRSDGTVISGDCPEGVRRQRLGARVWAGIAGMATSAALVLGLLSGRARADLSIGTDKKPAAPKTLMGEPTIVPTKPPKHVLMGKVAIHEPQPDKDKKRSAAEMGDVAP